PIVGRAGARFGERALAVPGALILASATWWYRTRVGIEPHYWKDWFFGATLAGLGINMAFPMLQSAAVRDVAPPRYSIANASTRTALQLGTAVGVALLVSTLGDGAAALADFRAAWLMISVFAVACAVLVSAIPGRVRPVTVADRAAGPQAAVGFEPVRPELLGDRSGN
ncbi:MAG TPA: MFS transporter, partial [Acidimicrobiales bacterium]|nr:MFS transporter [Acidimicrobiales bacterium]